MKKLLLLVYSLFALSGVVYAQDITGTWQGTLKVQKDLRTVVKIAKVEGGALKSVFYSIDQGGQPIPVSTTTLQGSSVMLTVAVLDGKFEGKLSSDGKTMTGTWTQGGQPLPLTLLRTGEAEAWAIPEPPARVPPMATDASAVFEVATIKPSKPDQQGKAFLVRGHRISTINTSLVDVITLLTGFNRSRLRVDRIGYRPRSSISRGSPTCPASQTTSS